MPADPLSTEALLLLTVGSIGALLFLVIVLRMQAFVALLVVSFVAAILGRVPPSAVADAITEGMGSTLGYIAVVIGVGTMLGAMIQESGGAGKIASTIIRIFGERKAQWALALIGVIVATPVFFEVGLIIFIPLIYDLARRTGKSLLYYGIPLLAGMAVAHACIPPTPGPVAVSSIIGADLGWVIFFGVVLAGIPAAAIGGVVFGGYVGNRIHVPIPETAERTEENVEGRKTPGFGHGRVAHRASARTDSCEHRGQDPARRRECAPRMDILHWAPVHSTHGGPVACLLFPRRPAGAFPRTRCNASPRGPWNP